jgi:hypothetical protein
MSTIKIKVSEYNEVCPTEIKKLLDKGAKIKKSTSCIGVPIYPYLVNYRQDIYTDDEIVINNVTLPLSIGGNYNHEIIINLKD